MQRTTDQDRFDALELLTERVYIMLVLTAKQRRLTDTETYLLQHAAKIAGGDGSTSKHQGPI